LLEVGLLEYIIKYVPAVTIQNKPGFLYDVPMVEPSDRSYRPLRHSEPPEANQTNVLMPVTLKDFERAYKAMLARESLGISPSDNFVDLTPDGLERAQQARVLLVLAS
jgi:hypothetical protein